MVTRTFRIGLDGAGWACGVTFRPGGWSAWSWRDAAPLTDRVVPAGPVLGPLGMGRLADALLAAGGPSGRHAALREVPERGAPEPDAVSLRPRGLVDRMRDDPSLVRVEQLPELVGWSPRTLQRHFRTRVGVSAKWVVARFRLQEAADELERDPAVNLAALSARLGRHDQAHFINDFRRLLGATPARYAAAAHR